MRPPVNVVILGGGTAGWMAAAGLSSLLSRNRCTVRLVESDDIGIVGVGEATLPHMKNFNDVVGIDEAEIMRRTQATFKLGIEFVDWGFLGSSYIHPFGMHGPPSSGLEFHHRWLRALKNGSAAPIEDYSYSIMAARQNRFDFPSANRSAISSTYSYAYHFDASLYAAFLRSFAESRGVTRTEGKVKDVLLDAESGDVESLHARVRRGRRGRLLHRLLRLPIDHPRREAGRGVGGLGPMAPLRPRVRGAERAPGRTDTLHPLDRADRQDGNGAFRCSIGPAMVMSSRASSSARTKPRRHSSPTSTPPHWRTRECSSSAPAGASKAGAATASRSASPVDFSSRWNRPASI